MNVVAIFDIGKTNKKAFLINESYVIVLVESAELPETTDEDGDACENIELLTTWMYSTWEKLLSHTEYLIKAVNFSGYGASFVLLDAQDEVCFPLYNYLKDFPKDLENIFYQKYGGKQHFAKVTASPILGNLNSGLQLYRLSKKQPTQFEKVKSCLHLPQYLSFLFSKQTYSEITSIGCHTALWDYEKETYHNWVKEEGILDKLPKITPSDKVFELEKLKVGAGLHDSSSALIPYLKYFHAPFILLSTGTWNIALNPFNQEPLSENELDKDCLRFFKYDGLPVKASRLFGGHFHQVKVKELAKKYTVPENYFKTIKFDESLITNQSISGDLNIAQEYHLFIEDLVRQQIESLNLIMHNSPVHNLYVDGGFSKNDVFMNLLKAALPEVEIFAAEVAQASAIGAALIIHQEWNTKAIPKELIKLKAY
jgi:L-fuculokinase